MSLPVGRRTRSPRRPTGSADFSAASGSGGLRSGALADGVSGAPVRHEVTQADLGSVRAPRSPGMFSVSSQMGIMKRALKRSASSTGLPRPSLFLLEGGLSLILC